jgi:hypothetical protein
VTAMRLHGLTFYGHCTMSYLLSCACGVNTIVAMDMWSVAIQCKLLGSDGELRRETGIVNSSACQIS